MSEEQGTVLSCSFCGHAPDFSKGEQLIKGRGEVYICTSCLEFGHEQVQDTKKRMQAQMKKLANKNAKPAEIQAFLDEYIIGQDTAKEVLATAAYNHYKMIKYKASGNKDVEIEKSNILLVGPTGSGKTYALRTLAKILGVPFAMQDANGITQAGYVGEDPEVMIRKLVEDADYDIERAETGIIYIDEIDKISRKGENLSITRDVGGEGVQQALLKIIEGAEVEITEKGQRKHPQAATFKVNTENILFVVGGSFEGIEKTIAKRLKKGKSSIGFSGQIESKKEVQFNDVIEEITVEDLKKFGMIPELLGRLPIIAPMKELSRDDIRRILTEPKNAIAKQYQELMKMDGVELEFTDDAFDAIADEANKRKTGARSLRSIMEATLRRVMFMAPSDENIVKVIVNAASVNGKALPQIEKKAAELPTPVDEEPEENAG